MIGVKRFIIILLYHIMVCVGTCGSGNLIERVLYIVHNIYSQRDRFLVGAIGCNHGCLLYMLSQQRFMDEQLRSRVRFENRSVGGKLDEWRNKS